LSLLDKWMKFNVERKTEAAYLFVFRCIRHDLSPLKSRPLTYWRVDAVLQRNTLLTGFLLSYYLI
jgi:hypothetical protein